MKIAVIGAGAMGSILGARFAQGGHDTVLVDVVGPLVETINADGVTVVRGEEETTTRVPATTDPGSVGQVDLVVFFTKCYHTASAAESARSLVGADTVVASLQNGWGNGYLGAYGTGSAIAAEFIATLIFVLVILGVTATPATAPVAGLVIGLTLFALHLPFINVTGLSVNPARSLGPAVFVLGNALAQVWLFLVVPAVAGAVAGWLHKGKVLAA